jgi:hypothetical protein
MQRDQARPRPRELTLEEILSSPITRAVMAADGVDPHEVDTMMRRIVRMRGAAVEGAEPGQEAGRSRATSHRIENGG